MLNRRTSAIVALAYSFFLAGFNIMLRMLLGAVIGSGWGVLLGGLIGIIFAWGDPWREALPKVVETYATAGLFGAALGAVSGMVYSIRVIFRQARRTIRETGKQCNEKLGHGNYAESDVRQDHSGM